MGVYTGEKTAEQITSWRHQTSAVLGNSWRELALSSTHGSSQEDQNPFFFPSPLLSLLLALEAQASISLGLKDAALCIPDRRRSGCHCQISPRPHNDARDGDSRHWNQEPGVVTHAKIFFSCQGARFPAREGLWNNSNAPRAPSVRRYFALLISTWWDFFLFSPY